MRVVKRVVRIPSGLFGWLRLISCGAQRTRSEVTRASGRTDDPLPAWLWLNGSDQVILSKAFSFLLKAEGFCRVAWEADCRSVSPPGRVPDREVPHRLLSGQLGANPTPNVSFLCDWRRPGGPSHLNHGRTRSSPSAATDRTRPIAKGIFTDALEVARRKILWGGLDGGESRGK